MFKNKMVSDNLDFIRGIAALAVMSCHLRAACFAEYAQLPNHSVIALLVYFFTGFGSEAVMIFFVLSGFLVGASVYEQFRKNTYSWFHFLVNRFVRLYLVLIPALIWSAIVVYFGYPLFVHLPPPSSHPLTLKNFLENLMFLQTIKTYSFAGNLPLWSLSNEFWYYLLFPLILAAFFLKKFFRIASYFLLVGAIFYLIGLEKSLYFTIWVSGFLVYFFYRLKPVAWLLSHPKFRLLISVVPLSSIVIEAYWNHKHIFSQNILNFITAASFAVFLYIMLHNNGISKKRGFYYHFSQKTASCSYTLYLIHYPMICLLEAVIIQVNKTHWPFDVKHGVYAGLIGVGIFYFAYFFAQITEAKTGQLRNFILTLLPRLKIT